MQTRAISLLMSEEGSPSCCSATEPIKLTHITHKFGLNTREKLTYPRVGVSIFSVCASVAWVF